MEVKTRGIVLHALKYGDSQLIVDIFTRDQGRLSFICHLPKTSRGKFKKELFQPLSVLEVVFNYRAHVSLQKFRDIRLAEPFASIPFDPYKLSIALFSAEFLLYSTRGELRNDALYDFIEKSLLWLDNVTERFSNFHIVFMMHCSRFIGFFPNLLHVSSGEWFDLRQGAFSATRPLHGDYLKPEEGVIMRRIMRMTYENMHLFRMTQRERNRCVELILHYYRLHIPNFPEMKSLPVLKALFE